MRAVWRCISLIVGLLIPTLFLSQHAVADPSYVLAVSWQPGFCETRPTVPECLNQTPDRYDATHFALHGLWPEPRGNFYCNVPKAEQDQDQRHEWGALPRLRLSAETRRQLEQAMPGTQSHLHRHEWVKHGTCSEMPDPETYYQESLRLLSALNTSPLQRLFADAIGSTLSGEAIRAVIDNAFGEGTGDRMQIVCKAVGPRNLIVALRFNLAGPLTGVDFATALRNASPRDPGCAGGEIDAVE